MKKILIFIYFFWMLPLITFAQNPQVLPKKFLEEISFEQNSGLMFIKVQIPPSKKVYKFLLDTGAPTTIAETVFQEIQAEIQDTILINSANNFQDSVKVVNLTNVKIGELNFQHIKTLVTNFERGTWLKCLDFDGVIGANLMSLAVWQFDWENRKIGITDKIKKLKKFNKKQYTGIKLWGWQKSPLIRIGIKQNEILETILFDTGFNGFFQWSKNTFQLAKDSAIITTKDILEGEGRRTEDFMGKDSIQKRYTVKLPDLRLAQEEFREVIADVSSGKASLLGSNLLRYFVVTLDFKKQRFYIFKEKEIKQAGNFKNFGFHTHINSKNEIYVSYLYQNSLAKEKLSLGDKLLQIEYLDLRSILAENACRTYAQMRKILREKDEIQIILLRDSQEKKIILYKNTFFKK